MRRSLLVLFCLLASSLFAAERYHLARVLVTGSERYRQEDLVRATGLNLDSQITVEDLQNAANRLGGSGAFSSVQYIFKAAPGGKGVEADFQVADSDKFLPASFENFVWFSDNELLEAIRREVPLFHGLLPASGGMSDEVSTALGKTLAARGLPSEVTYMLSAESGQLPSVYKFRVVNANLAVKDVLVSGADHMAPDLLARALAPLKQRPYLRTELEKVLDSKLAPLYRQHGFIQFAILDIKPRVDGGNQVRIEVSVNEGQQFRLGSLHWSGNTLISNDELGKRITLKSGDLVNGLQLDHDLAQIGRLFGRFGHEAATVDAAPSFSGNTVDYNIAVKEGDAYRMGKVEIQGIDPDQALGLIKGWKLPEGELYDNTYIRRFLEYAVLKLPGQWQSFEQVDDARKIVDVKLQVKAR